MDVFLHHFAIGAAGAAAFEALKLWYFREKWTRAKFCSALSSSVLWIPLLLMLAASGFLAWAYYEKDVAASAWNLAMVGVTARTIIRESVSVWAIRKLKHETKLGSEHVTFGDIFS